VASTEVAQRLAGSLVRPEWQTADEDVPAQMKVKRIPTSNSSSADQTRFPVCRWYALIARISRWNVDQVCTSSRISGDSRFGSVAYYRRSPKRPRV
jgi:hypothetical protein